MPATSMKVNPTSTVSTTDGASVEMAADFSEYFPGSNSGDAWETSLSALAGPPLTITSSGGGPSTPGDGKLKVAA